MASVFAICLIAATPPGAGLVTAAYAEEGGGNSGQLWCHMCDKPFPCGYEYHDEVRQELTTHVDSGDGTIVEYVTPTGTGYIPAENPSIVIDTGAANIGGGQGGGAYSGFEDSAGTGTGGTGGTATIGDESSITDTDAPTSGATGLWAGFTGLVGDTVLDEDGGVKTWALAAGVIIIALIALGAVMGARRRARIRRRKQARLAAAEKGVDPPS